MAPPDYLYAQAGTGHDSNVTLAPDDAAATSEEGAAFVDAYAAIRRPVGSGVYLRGSAYLQHFPEDSDSDLLSLRGGVGRVGRLTGAWRWDARADVRHQRFGGEAFETALLAGAGVERDLGEAWRLALDYRFERAQGGNDFGFLDGTGHRVTATLAQRGEAGWRLEAAVETLDRDDLARGDDFFSFSRDELDLGVRRGFALPGRLRLALEADWARRRYDGTEVRDGTRLRTRQDDRVGLGVELGRRLGGGWSARASLRAEERDSNIDGFDYERTVVGLRLERLF